MPLEERIYIGLSSKGFVIVLDEHKNPAATIKDYALTMDGAIIFELNVTDPALAEAMETGDPAPEFIWNDPVTCMFGLTN